MRGWCRELSQRRIAEGTVRVFGLGDRVEGEGEGDGALVLVGGDGWLGGMFLAVRWGGGGEWAVECCGGSWAVDCSGVDVGLWGSLV